jgi:hypothetical protein
MPFTFAREAYAEYVGSCTTLGNPECPAKLGLCGEDAFMRECGKDLNICRPMYIRSQDIHQHLAS